MALVAVARSFMETGTAMPAIGVGPLELSTHILLLKHESTWSCFSVIKVNSESETQEHDTEK